MRRTTSAIVLAVALAASPLAALADFMDELVRLKLDRDTMVVFTSDNGPADEYGADQRFFGSNGPFDVYPCDFFVSSATRLGNIMETGWRELRESPAAKVFAAQKCRRHLSRIAQMDFYDRIRESLHTFFQPSP